MDDITKLLKAELIGRSLRLVRLKDSVALQGRIIDETKNTVVVMTGGTKKRLIKALYAFEFDLGNKVARIDGAVLQKRPEERIKIKLMKRW